MKRLATMIVAGILLCSGAAIYFFILFVRPKLLPLYSGPLDISPLNIMTATGLPIWVLIGAGYICYAILLVYQAIRGTSRAWLIAIGAAMVVVPVSIWLIEGWKANEHIMSILQEYGPGI